MLLRKLERSGGCRMSDYWRYTGAAPGKGIAEPHEDNPNSKSNSKVQKRQGSKCNAKGNILEYASPHNEK
jgi:hypothetical protein